MKHSRAYKNPFVWLGCLLAGGLLALLIWPAQSGIAQEVSSPTFAQEVILLVNQERAVQELPPLKGSPELSAAAGAHSRAMAEWDFFDHTNPHTGSTVGDRVTAAGYEWSFVAENIGQGYSTPAGVVEGWMDSPGHRVNILSADVREIGMGYVFDAKDAMLCGDLPCQHYWTQNFGTRADFYPVIINGEAISTTTPEVSLYIYGQDWATETRLRNDDEPFSEWEPFADTREWTLPAEEGLHTVTVELRDGFTMHTASDDIHLISESLSEAPASTFTPMPAPPSLPPALPGVISVSKMPTPLELLAGQSADVAITLKGLALPECQGIPGKPLDVMLVYDISDSAGAGSGSNWEQTITFTLQLLDQLTQPIYRQCTSPPEQSQLGLITSQTGTYGPKPRLLQELTQGYARLRAAITDIQPGGDTEIAAGIDLAAEVLAGQPADRAQAIVLMLHDNKAIDQAAIEAVQRVSAHVPVYIIANSRNLLEVDRITPDLATQLVTADKFYNDPQPENIRHLFVTATEGNLDDIARDLQISDEFTPAASVELSDVTGPGGRGEGARAVWDIASLEEGDAFDLNYTIRVPVNATGFIERTGRATYLDCNGYLQSRIVWQETIFLTPVTPTPAPSLTPEIALTPTPLPPGGPVQVLCVPWYAIENKETLDKVEFVLAPHDAWAGLEVTLKGMARAVAGSVLTFAWDFGDDSPPETGEVIDPYAIAARHIYADAPAGTVYHARLTVTDTTKGHSDSCEYQIVMRQRALPVEVNVAIDEALWHLHTRMGRGEDKDGMPLGDWSDPASTSMAILAFEVQGHQLSGDWDEDPYVETVQRGLNSLLAQLQEQELDVQLAGDPDANGNGIGLYVGPTQYQDGMILMALAGSDAPDAVAEIGGINVHGRAYREIAQDVVDFLVWAQTDSPDYMRGGWRYRANGNDADMSVTQWPALGLLGIESADRWEHRSSEWSVIVPAWAKTELRENFLHYIQDNDGGFGYVDPSSGKNLAKAGAGLALLAWTGVPAGRPDALDDAQAYIAAHWNDADDDWGYPGNLGNLYTMYGIMKGSRLHFIETYGGHDWYEEYAAYLIQNQGVDGHWEDQGWASGNLPLCTAWGILILSPTIGVGEPPPPPPPSPVTPTPLPTPVPVSVTLSLCPGTSSPPYVIEVNLPPAPTQADVLFVFDVSYSMEPVLDSAASNADVIMGNLVDLLGSDVQVGVVSFSDYPIGPYGAVGDRPYVLLQAITSDQNSVRTALNALSLEEGGDGPEAYTRALYEAYADPAIGWRGGARHFIVTFGDSIPHDDDLNVGVPEPQPFEPGTEWITGEAPSYRDPGRDGTPGTPDDLDFQSVLQELGEEGYTLLHVISGEGAGATSIKLLPYWQAWTGQTPGGQAVSLDDAAQIPRVVQALVAGAAREIEELSLVADPGYEAWLAANPPAYADLDIPAGGFSPRFETVFTVPPDMPASDYHFQVHAIADGTVYGTWSVEVTVPETCAPLLPELECVTPEEYCTEWYWKLLPFLLLLLVLLLWWLLQPLLCGPDWLEKKRERGWKCWLPCLLALLLTLLVAYLLGRWLSDWLCYTLASRTEPAPTVITTPAPGAPAVAGPVVGQDGSQNVAVIIHGGLFDLSSERPGVSFTQIDVDDLTADTLAQYDTLLISQVCNVSQLPAPQLATVVNWVGVGHKLIIYDSDECAQPVNYDWLLYCFTTSNPGARGSTAGEFVIVTEDSMISADPFSPVYVDEAEMSTHTEIGDANVMVTQDMHWCCDAEAENLLGQRGCVHTYAFYGTGLIIYNGLDTDSISVPAQYRLWQNELNQPWDSVAGDPMGLTCQRRVVSLAAFPWWLLIPLPFLWLLAWWLCCRKKQERLPLPPLRGKLSPRPPLAFTDYWIGPPPEWDPAPALIIGLGGTGRWILTHLKKNLLDAGIGTQSERVRLLALDTSPAELVEGREVTIEFAGVRLDEDELLVLSENLRDVCQQMIRDANAHPELQVWFPAEEYLRVRRLPNAELDVRKGTRGRRPMGRAAVFQDVRQEEASRLWQRLLVELRRVVENERVQVFVVGSLAGGFGSAVVADVAYLARRAAHVSGASEGVVISGFLATDNAFVVRTRTQTLRLNAMATLRELGRFQLARGRPYPMTYMHTSREMAFNGYCEWGLLDDLFLFDGQRPERALTRYEPSQAIFPMMADALTILLDRAAHPLEEGRANTRVQASAEQLAHGEAMISSLGSFVYRLPMYDLVEELKVRFAKDLLRLYLVGPDFKDRALVLHADQNREPYPDGIAALVQHFLREEVGGATGWIADLARSGIAPAVAESVGLAAGEQEQAFLEEQLKTFKTNLTGRLLLILDGSPDVDAITARSGKLGYARDFLAELHTQLNQAQGQAQVVQSALSDVGAEGARLLGQLISQELEIVQTRTGELETGIAFLVGQGAILSPGEEAPQHGLSDRLLEELKRRATRRRGLREIVVRHYFADDKLVDELYRDHFVPHLETTLERLFWREGEDNGIELTLRHWEDVVIKSGQADVDEFHDALLKLAGAMSRDVWKLRLSDFLDEVETGLWRATVLQEEADRARGWASPTVVYQIGRAPQSLAQRFLWVNRTVQQAEPFRQVIQRLARAGDVGRLLATDPYSAGLLTTLDIVPLSALEAVRGRLEVDYRHAYAVSDETAGAIPAHLLPEPIHVFAAERHALQYEQRLYELNEPPRQFHPLFVAALDDLRRARTFALAYALGLIRRRYHRGERKEGQRYQVILPGRAGGGGDEEVWLTRHDSLTDSLALVVRAMQGFVVGHPQEDVVQSKYSPQQLYQAVAEVVEARVTGSRPRLQKFLREVPGDLRDETRLGVPDLLSFARLVVRDELQRLYQSEEHN